MVEIRLHDSRTRQKQSLEPLVTPGRPAMYVCGPTVYDRAHLGNARPVVVFDVLFRLLRHVYGADAVTYVRNFTDVDDKINARAAETGRPIRAITDETTRWYLDDMAALGALEPTHMPRATDHIGGMIALIERLIARGHAYEAAGHVLFSVSSWPDYGKFSGRSVDDMLAGARVDVAPYKRDPMDFVLWKPSSPDLPGWDSPWGRGRPGWHIECSAMSFAILGPEFDIHGGGLDLMFPHHENEIAQSVCATGGGFARLWMHNEMLLVEGRKMSKSLGNFFTVRDLLSGKVVIGAREHRLSGLQIRTAFLMSHYREQMDLNISRVQEVDAFLAKCFRFIGSLGRAGIAALSFRKSEVDREVLSALCDDLNTPAAFARLNELLSEANQLRNESRYDFALRVYSSLRLLGLDVKRSSQLRDFVPFEESILEHRVESTRLLPSKKLLEYKRVLSDLRVSARETRNYDLYDQTREKLKNFGIEVRVASNGVEVVRGLGVDLRLLPNPKTLLSDY
jgi:cysteinyl-tRNA synthetase